MNPHCNAHRLPNFFWTGTRTFVRFPMDQALTEFEQHLTNAVEALRQAFPERDAPDSVAIPEDRLRPPILAFVRGLGASPAGPPLQAAVLQSVLSWGGPSTAAAAARGRALRASNTVVDTLGGAFFYGDSSTDAAASSVAYGPPQRYARLADPPTRAQLHDHPVVQAAAAASGPEAAQADAQPGAAASQEADPMLAGPRENADAADKWLAVNRAIAKGAMDVAPLRERPGTFPGDRSRDPREWARLVEHQVRQLARLAGHDVAPAGGVPVRFYADLLTGAAKGWYASVAAVDTTGVYQPVNRMPNEFLQALERRFPPWDEHRWAAHLAEGRVPADPRAAWAQLRSWARRADQRPDRQAALLARALHRCERLYAPADPSGFYHFLRQHPQPSIIDLEAHAQKFLAMLDTAHRLAGAAGGQTTGRPPSNQAKATAALAEVQPSSPPAKTKAKRRRRRRKNKGSTSPGPSQAPAEEGSGNE